ncbi:Yop proteins translocation protein U [Candidatus Xiphinematobacter sp. Idaho Grape]|uniref:EscU/YscU/HrcU family type III secretion system export apparatus switch protein n=1 Tax=Candidatus Xiphinematobacter sp. Idaho Grape TaxID=1704307 RepID=UPI0007056BD4|nr:EscU/YscU/HrcU family type III secretion system export apparatus switch protein [Candidatus Xiphinematobacter sp. Idaho Grape]ALJ56893.1 Yop proteins translocation protein U [Candidatus Xiphinematobacter sp. Idaho Grape]
MSEERGSAERTEKPTPRRLGEARKRGQVAKSVEVVITVSAAIILATVFFSFPHVKLWLEDLFATIFLSLPKKKEAISPCLQQAAKIVCFEVGLVAAASCISVIVGNVAQFGFLLSFFPLNPELTRLNPVQGLKRIFSIKTLFEFTKSVLKILVLGSVITWIGWFFVGQLVLLPFAGFAGITQAISKMLIFFCAVIWTVWALLSIIDFLVQKYLHTKQLMMTVQEVRRESKETEGDPRIKHVRRGIHQEILLEDTATATRRSTVVITNPVHYAVAIYYARRETPLPILRAKGAGFIALLMTRIASEEGIPVIENVPIARVLYKKTKVSDVIPYDLLAPVAEILRWVSMLPTKNSSG